MSKTETWRDAVKRQNEADLMSRADLLSKLAESAEILAESMAQLSEETRGVLSELQSTAESVKGETSTAGSTFQKTLLELTTTTQETRSALSTWKSQLGKSVSESERRISRSLRGLAIKLWLAMMLSAILSGALSGWLIWQWSSRQQEERQNAYQAGMRAVIGEMSKNYTITPKTAPLKSSRRSSAPTDTTGSTSGSVTKKPAE